MNLSNLVECIRFVGRNMDDTMRCFCFTGKNRYIDHNNYEHLLSIYEGNGDVYRCEGRGEMIL